MLKNDVHWQHNAEHKCSEIVNYFGENPDFICMNFEIETTMDALLNNLPSNLPLIAIIEAERAHIVIEKTPVAEYAEYDFLNLVKASSQSASSVFTTATPDRVMPRSATMMAVFGIAISSFSLKQMLASSGANKSAEAALTLRKF